MKNNSRYRLLKVKNFGSYDLAVDLKNIRERRHLSQMELANMVDVSKSTISYIERGVFFPSLELLVKLSIVLCVPLSDLVDCYDCYNQTRIFI